MILFSDFDKTLYFREDSEKTKNNFGAIVDWKERGNCFCVVTGRSFRSVTEQAPEMKNLCDYFIVDSGSIIASKSGEIIKAFYFDETVVSGIVEFSKSFSEIPIAYYYSPEYEGTNTISKNVTKLRLWFKDMSMLNSTAEKLREKFPVFAFCSEFIIHNNAELESYVGFVEIIPDTFGKGSAIRYLVDMLGVPVSDIITIGDGFNDFSMVKDFDGYAIKDSELSNHFMDLKTADSISSLIKDLEDNNE